MVNPKTMSTFLCTSRELLRMLPRDPVNTNQIFIPTDILTQVESLKQSLYVREEFPQCGFVQNLVGYSFESENYDIQISGEHSRVSRNSSHYTKVYIIRHEYLLERWWEHLQLKVLVNQLLR